MSDTSPEKILIIINSMNVGGAETFAMKLFRKIDKSKIIMDFLVNTAEDGFYSEEIRRMGGQVYHTYPKSKHPFKNFMTIKRIVRANKYSIVVRFAEHPIVATDLIAAKLGGAKKTIVRSTNTSTGKKFSNVIAFFFRPLLNLNADVKIAPSTESAIWLFGKRAVKKNKITLLKNGLDFDYYRFSETRRNLVRRQLNISSSALVFGHIGRFNAQKNHFFLIDLFLQILKQWPNSILALVGDGDLKSEVERYAFEKGLSGCVLFLGVRTDIPDLLSSFDCFLLPSLYEGLPNVIIEAQAVNLPCVLSDAITKEVAVTNLVSFCSFKDDKDVWCKEIEKKLQLSNDRKQPVYMPGYSIDEITNQFVEMVTK